MSAKQRVLDVHMPAYNSGEFISEALDAVFLDLEQSGITPEESRVIVANDGSTDNTLEVVKTFAEEHQNLEIIDLENNLGLGAVHQLLLDRSTKDPQDRPFAFSFRDSDDISIPGSSSKLLVELEPPGVGLVGGGLIEFVEGNDTDRRVLFPHSVPSRAITMLSRGLMPVFNPTSMMKTESVVRSLENRPYPQMKFCDDLLFQAGLIADGVDFKNIADVVVEYRKHQGSVTSGWVPRNSVHYLKACRTIWTMSPEFEPSKSDRAFVYARTVDTLILPAQSAPRKLLRKIYRTISPSTTTSSHDIVTVPQVSESM